MHIQPKINDLWDGASKDYDAAPGHGMSDAAQVAAWSDALRALLPPPPARVLDAGTGTGVIALLLAGLGHDVTGIDLSEGMLEQARRKAAASGRPLRFEAGDAINPPGDPASYDAIVSRHVLWTLTDPSRALRNWLRLLRGGGRAVIIDGLWGRTSDARLDADIAASLPLMTPSATLDDVTALVRDAGFREVVASDLAEVDRIERALINDPEFQPHYTVTGIRAG